ncbi:MAG: hypothetical protein M1839_003972 [Geoglossum umbratile]|nr:MAG: hypothetical protein M1839_003972 [Geoglossum umbratile]
MRDTGKDIVFESFEASPLTTTVTITKGNLRRSFPGRVVAVPYTTFKDPLFRHELATTLHRLSVEHVSDVMAKTRKAGSRICNDVCWDNQLLAWRRSGLWLVVRVAIQKVMVDGVGNDRGRVQLRRDFVGISALRSRLSSVLFHQIKTELPSLIKDVQQEIKKAQTKLFTLGERRSTPDEQRLFLLLQVYELETK